MSTATTCPACGSRMKLGRIVDHGSFVSKRRDCTNASCGHADKVHVRVKEEILAVIAVAKRRLVRKRTLQPPQTKTSRKNKTRRKPC